MQAISVQHPLEPLTSREIAESVEIVRLKRSVGAQFRFPCVTLHEPKKSTVLAFQPGDLISREAFMILLDTATGFTYEAVVSLSKGDVTSWQHIPHAQPNIMADELAECEAVVKENPVFRMAIAKRGITDLDLVVVDPWAIGNFGFKDEEGIRLSRCLCYLRSVAKGNFYSRPIDGLVPVVDLNKMEVLQIEDVGSVAVPTEPGEYAKALIPKFREDIKPLHITQPEGPSFEVKGHQVCWQKWQFRIGFTPREGVVLHTVGYEDEGRLRPILYRASMSEMVVPYGDPRSQHFRKNAFDLGEHGIGLLSNSLKLGCDCVGEIYYFDAALTNSRGDVSIIENAICLHEEDYGILWKHTDWRLDEVEVRRSRRLVVSFIATVDNYEYGFYWYFYQDGTLQYEVKLTGILLCAALADTPKYGTLVAPELNALNHQHFFNMRLDFDLDGLENSVYEVNTEAAPLGPDNPYGNGFFATATLLPTEQAAQRTIDPFTARYWKITNPSALNALGQPVGFKLIPGDNALPFAHADSPLLKRAGFMTKHLWVTPYQADERYAAGNYPNQHPGGEGLPKWTAGDRPIENTDVVLWYTFGHHHIPRPEDWPVMLSTVGTIETQMTQCARTLFSMGRDRVIHEKFAEIHPRFQTPWLAGLVITVLALFLLILSSSSESVGAVMANLISAIGIMVSFYYGMTGLACAYYYRKVLRRDRKTLSLKGIWPVSSAIFLLILAIVQIPALGWSVSLFTLGAITLGCLPMVYYRLKYRSSFYSEPAEWHNPRSIPSVERSLERV